MRQEEGVGRRRKTYLIPPMLLIPILEKPGKRDRRDEHIGEQMGRKMQTRSDSSGDSPALVDTHLMPPLMPMDMPLMPIDMPLMPPPPYMPPPYCAIIQ